MKKILLAVAIVLGGVCFMISSVQAQEGVVVFSFENGLEGWEIPDWAYEKADYVQQEIDQSDKYASEGKSSLEMSTDFPKGRWTGAIVEIMQYFDWTDYSAISVDIYLPEDAPLGLKSKIILTVGDEWKWIEQSKSVKLKPGEWVTISANLKPGSIDWRRIQPDDSFRADIRKIDIRVEANNKPAYTGPIYIDNVRLTK